jgi:hypothetical protein
MASPRRGAPQLDTHQSRPPIAPQLDTHQSGATPTGHPSTTLDFFGHPPTSTGSVLDTDLLSSLDTHPSESIPGASRYSPLPGAVDDWLGTPLFGYLTADRRGRMIGAQNAACLRTTEYVGVQSLQSGTTE